MTEDYLHEEGQALGRWQEHKFMVLIGLTITVSMLLVSLSLWLYNNSGAAQLDLSRPGYQEVRDQAKKTTDFSTFSSSGPIDAESLKEFRKMYDEQYGRITSTQNFGGDVMNDSSLGIDSPPVAH